MNPFTAFVIGAIVGGFLALLAAWSVWPKEIEPVAEFEAPRRRKWRDRDEHEDNPV